MPKSWGASRAIAVAGTSSGERAPGQIPQPSLSSDPSGVVPSVLQQGAAESAAIPMLAGHWPHDIGFSGPHWHGFRMFACAMLNSARRTKVVVRTRTIGGDHTPPQGACKGCVRGPRCPRRLDATGAGPLAAQVTSGTRAPRIPSYYLT